MTDLEYAELLQTSPMEIIKYEIVDVDKKIVSVITRNCVFELHECEKIDNRSNDSTVVFKNETTVSENGKNICKTQLFALENTKIYYKQTETEQCVVGFYQHNSMNREVFSKMSMTNNITFTFEFANEGTPKVNTVNIYSDDDNYSVFEIENKETGERRTATSNDVIQFDGFINVGETLKVYAFSNNGVISDQITPQIDVELVYTQLLKTTIENLGTNTFSDTRNSFYTI